MGNSNINNGLWSFVVELDMENMSDQEKLDFTYTLYTALRNAVHGVRLATDHRNRIGSIHWGPATNQEVLNG